MSHRHKCPKLHYEVPLGQELTAARAAASEAERQAGESGKLEAEGVAKDIGGLKAILTAITSRGCVLAPRSVGLLDHDVLMMF